MKNKLPFVVYWKSKYKRKWKSCTTEDKAKRLKRNLEKQGCVVWIAEDI